MADVCGLLLNSADAHIEGLIGVSEVPVDLSEIDAAGEQEGGEEKRYAPQEFSFCFPRNHDATPRTAPMASQPSVGMTGAGIFSSGRMK